MTKAQQDALLRAAVEMVAQAGDYGNSRVRALAAAVEAIAPGRIERTKKTNARKQAATKEAMRWQGNPPVWAKRLIEKYTPSTRLTWRRSRDQGLLVWALLRRRPDHRDRRRWHGRRYGGRAQGRPAP